MPVKREPSEPQGFIKPNGVGIPAFQDGEEVNTQKPTTDCLPSQLRDNCGARICFQISTPEAARAVLGNLPDGSPSPLDAAETVCSADTGFEDMVLTGVDYGLAYMF